METDRRKQRRRQLVSGVLTNSISNTYRHFCYRQDAVLDFPTNAAVPAVPPVGVMRTYSVKDNDSCTLDTF